jgi:hypothetical protein
VLAGSHSSLIGPRIKSRALTGAQAFALVSTISTHLTVRPSGRRNWRPFSFLPDLDVASTEHLPA